MSRFSLNRRGFFGVAAGALALNFSPRGGRAGERPPVTNPRATSGDDRHEPAWEQRLVITVGPRRADVVGSTDKPIQAALDYVARLGGGTVQLLPGTFTRTAQAEGNRRCGGALRSSHSVIVARGPRA